MNPLCIIITIYLWIKCKKTNNSRKKKYTWSCWRMCSFLVLVFNGLRSHLLKFTPNTLGCIYVECRSHNGYNKRRSKSIARIFLPKLPLVEMESYNRFIYFLYSRPDTPFLYPALKSPLWGDMWIYSSAIQQSWYEKRSTNIWCHFNSCVM